MYNSLKMIAVLTITGFLSGGFLTFVYQKTVLEIEMRSLESLRKAIFVVLPEAVNYKKLRLGEELVYQGIDKKGRKVGLAFLAKGSGYQGKIKIMVGVDQDLNRIQNIQVLESVETPGLGGKITEEGFQGQFKGLSIKEGIKLAEEAEKAQPSAEAGATIQAITGATISSKAVVSIINRKIDTIREILQKKNGERL